MVVSVIHSQISATELTVRPGYSEARLAVDVVNYGDRQASFHVLLSVTGEEGQPQQRWYRLTPMTSSKVPVGTHSTYTVDIFDTPLVGFVGIANITIRIISPELQSEERHVMRLRVEPGIDTVPFKLEVLDQTIQDYPGETIEIPIRIHNASRYPLPLTLSCPVLDSWLMENSPTHLNLRPNRWHEATLLAQIPADLSHSHSRAYPFQIVAADENGNQATAAGSVDVLPLGHFELSVEQTALTIPSPLQWWPNWRSNSVQTQLHLHNHSNLTDTLRVRTSWLQQRDREDVPLDGQVTLVPDAVQLAPGQIQAVETTIQVKRPWVGWVKRLLIEIQASTDRANLDLKNDTETVQVTVVPVLPRWLQFLALLLFGGAIALLWYVHTYGQQHRQLVSSVQLNGLGTQVISGSSDQTIRRWRVNRGRLRPEGKTIRLDKAVRVLEYRPVDNNQIAVGLENGEIQLWDLLKGANQPRRTLVNQTGQTRELDDRVMALATTADARHLFSGYGSGLVSQWYIGQDSLPNANERPLRELVIPDLAIYDMALVGPEEEGVAIAGRYNKLFLWPWAKDGVESKEFSIPYPPGGQDDYITGLDTADQTPFRLATADNQGRLMLWDVESCMDQGDDCRVIDQWQPTPESPIRDVALSANGCYLTSVSDDGQVTLWPLTRQGRRQTKHLDGIRIKHLKTGLNSVDIKQLDSRLLIVSGADNKRVSLYSHRNISACQ
ncbi:MAG: hypothetical protein AAGD25_00080 [Cyanobacteria bacterium P01_F01_bin.150]